MSWYLKVSLSFFRGSVLSSTLIPVATLVSQLFLLAAFLLPLKILILLGGSEIPEYFPDLLKLIQYKELVVYLTISTALLYVAHLLLDTIIERLVHRQAVRVINKQSKLAIFANQNEIIAKAYQCYAVIIAGVIFVISAIIVGFLVYPKNIILLLSFVSVTCALIWCVNKLCSKCRRFFYDKVLFIANTICGVAFFVSFALMIYDFFEGDFPGILLAIITLILVRQAVTQVRNISGSINSMYTLKSSIYKILFDDYSMGKGAVSLNQKDTGQKASHQQIATKVVENYLRNGEVVSSVSWVQSGIPDVQCFSIILNDSNEKLFVRCFDSKRSVLAKNEAYLLTEVPELPALELLHHHEVDNTFYHVFRDTEGEKPSEKEKTLWSVAFYSELILKYKPAESVACQYRRTHPLLWQRIETDLLSEIAQTLDAESRDYPLAVDWLSEYFDEIKTRLSNLPLSIINVNINRDSLVRLPNGRVLSNYWGGWGLDCLGAGWPTQPEYLESLIESLQSGECWRDDLQGIYPGDACLAALIFKVEYLCGHRHYQSAIELLPVVRQYFDNRGEPLG